MSTHDSASAPTSAQHSEVVSARSAETTSDSSRKRSLVLLGILALLLGALWYDYKVARPSVETAYEMVGQKNSEYNAFAGKKYLTEKEVQSTLNRVPASFIDQGPYHVEVYSWRSGLPIRSHNYYAVYSAGTPLIFLKHYKFELPMEELESVKVEGPGGPQTSLGDESAGSSTRRPPESTDERPSSEAGKSNADEQPSNKNETPTPAKSEATEAKSDGADQPKANDEGTDKSSRSGT